MAKDSSFFKKCAAGTAVSFIVLTIAIIILAILVIVSEDDDINYCNPNPCQNNSTCYGGVDRYICVCRQGYEGVHCESVNHCDPSPCYNRASCKSHLAGFNCSCIPGFNGTTCENNIDDCAGNPCKNGGTCQDGINKYKCACVPGYTGRNCKIAPRVPMVIKNYRSTSCLESFNSTYLTLSSGCSGNSYLWNYTTDGLLRSQKSQNCLGVVGTPGVLSQVRNFPCNSTDENQQWICVGNDLKLKKGKFYLQGHSSNTPPTLLGAPNAFTKWINPATSDIICN